MDLILMNQPRSFQSIFIFDTGLSDFQRLTVTVLETCFIRNKSLISLYIGTIKKISNETFREELAKELSERNVQVDLLDLFQKNAPSFLSKETLVKKWHFRNSQSVFIMTCSLHI